MKRETLEAILAAREAMRPAALVTDLRSGLQSIVHHDEINGELALSEQSVSAARTALGGDRSGHIEAGDGALFVHVFNPPARLVVVGAVHITQALAPMAALAGYAVTVVDPRGAFATEQRFPGVSLDDAWPDEALTALAPDHRTAVVTLTHDPKLDDPALSVALRSPCFYIGALGSRRTHAARLERLREAGFGDADFERIHGPIGLSIGAKSPAEIALSILAQITEVSHRRAAA